MELIRGSKEQEAKKRSCGVILLPVQSQQDRLQVKIADAPEELGGEAALCLKATLG